MVAILRWAKMPYKTPKENNVIGLPALDNIRSGEAEYLIITHSDFIGPALEEFVALRSTKIFRKRW